MALIKQAATSSHGHSPNQLTSPSFCKDCNPLLALPTTLPGPRGSSHHTPGKHAGAHYEQQGGQQLAPRHEDAVVDQLLCSLLRGRRHRARRHELGGVAGDATRPDRTPQMLLEGCVVLPQALQVVMLAKPHTYIAIGTVVDAVQHLRSTASDCTNCKDFAWAAVAVILAQEAIDAPPGSPERCASMAACDEPQAACEQKMEHI